MIKIANESSYPYTGWVDFSLPKNIDGDSKWDTLLFGKQKHPLVKGSDGFYSTRVSIPAFTTQVFELAKLGQVYKFKLSDWISDNINDLIPAIQIVFGNDQIAFLEFKDIKLIEDNEAVKIYELTAFSMGWKSRMSVSIYSEQDIAELQFYVRWSDRTDPSWSVSVKSIDLFSREEIWLDYAKKLGVTNLGLHNNGVYALSLFRNGVMYDGQPLNFRGAMLCRPQWMNDPILRAKLSPEDEQRFLSFHQDRFTNFLSRKEFPVVAMADWRNNLGPSESAKLLPTSLANALRELDARVDSFRASLYNSGGHFDIRFYSNLPNTGATGDQIVFGSVKDAASIAAQDPRFLHVLGYHHTYPMRPFHWHEVNGKDLKAKDHPNCTTWNLLPDHRLGSDMLGKPRNWVPSNFAGGYNGPDEEHHQQLYETFAAKMRREPILRWSFESLIQASLMMKKNRMGAPRAIGRQLDTWMEVLSILPHRKLELESLIFDKVAATKAQWVGKTVTGGVKPLNTVGKNGRGLLNFDYWVPWEQALFALGAYKYIVQYNDPEFRSILESVTKSVVNYGVLKDPAGNFHIGTAIKWNPDGTPVEITDWATQVGTGNDKEIRLDSNFIKWTLPAVFVYTKIGTDEATLVRAREIIQYFYGNVSDLGLRDVEWLSI